MNKMYVYRNTAIEYLFKGMDFKYSGYDDFSITDNNDILIFYMLPYKYSKSELINLIEEYKKRVEFIVNNNKNKEIYAFTLYNYFYDSWIFNDDELDMKICEYNHFLYQNKDVKVIDISKFYKEKTNTFDSKYYYTYDAIINPRLAQDFNNYFKEQIEQIKTTRKKCLVIDLDNTLWGGIVGEDGAANLKISGFYPGNCYNTFQKMILELKKQGIILCICSKNNYEDVEECFAKREDLVLSLEDFTIKKISWNSKKEEVKNIAQELNIGLDSIVFIDDNPVERENVKTLNEVIVPDFPKEPYMMPEFFAQIFKKYFGTYSLTQEDIDKSKQYEYKVKSDKLKESATSEDDFIKSLNIKIIYEEMNDFNIERIEQLINKSNQFNLTTHRYTKTDLLNMNNSIISCIRVIDKFGDLGITGVAIVNVNDDQADIDSFLLSCRILGRKIEKEYLKIIINRLYEKGIKNIKAHYIKSAKNSQVKDFYLTNDFEEIQKDEKETIYKKDIIDKVILDSKYEVEVKHGREN